MIIEDHVRAEQIQDEALGAVPDFYELPDELRTTIEDATVRAERMFWLRAQHIEDTPVTRTLLRRAMYAEARCWEMENRLAEVSLVASGMKAEIERLQDQLTDLSKATGG